MRWLCLVTLLVSLPAWAEAPDSSVRPQDRIGDSPDPVLLPLRPVQRPVTRPLDRAAGTVVKATPSAVSQTTLTRSPRPTSRPTQVLREVRARQRQAQRGMVCEIPQIQGDWIGVVPGRIKGCGISEAVRVKSVSGVVLSQPALMDCPTAKALNRWVINGVRPSLRTKGRVVQLNVAAHYACRTRNNQPGARISEHGKGRAIDISGFRMQDGEVITVRDHWTARGYREAMRRLHRTACGPFGTVLGPESDRFHQSHFHLDTARHRSGPFCR